MSDVAIHKICKKHNVPNPPLGYWAKKTHGKSVSQTPLPRLDEGQIDTIVITGGNFLAESASLKAAREQARINATAIINQAVIRRHPIVERTLAALQKAKLDDRGLVHSARKGCISVAVAPASLERVGITLDRLVAAAMIQGFNPDKSNEGVVFSGQGTTISFGINETVKRIKHELTPDELAEEERHRKKLGRDEWFSPLLFGSRFPEWDYIPTGQLAVELETIYFSDGSAPRRNFRDGKTQKLETMAEDISVGLAVFASAKIEKMRRDHERAEQMAIERQQRQQAERQRHVTTRRYEEMTSVLDDIEQILRLRDLLQSLEPDLTATENPRATTFVKWANSYIDEMTIKLSANGLEERFSRERVFGADDDFGFYPRSY